MSMAKSALEQWLAEIGAEAYGHNEVWDPGFDGNRQVVVVKLGTYTKVKPRPAVFSPRFYQKLYQLPIEDWPLRSKIQLYGGFCSLDINLAIRFQATVKYALLHSDVLPELNQHIKASSEIVIRDAIDQELQRLDDGAWIEEGLAPVEKRLQTRINEALIMQHIQCRALCEIHPVFKDTQNASRLDDPFTREDIYLKVRKKNAEFQERQNQEQFLQQQKLEQQRLEQQSARLEQREREEQIKRTEQAFNAEAARRQLEEREQQLTRQIEIEQRLHNEQASHQARLKELEQQAFREAEHRQQIKQFELEQQLLEEKLKHQQQLKERERAAELKDFEERQTKWNAAREHMQFEKITQEKKLQQLEAEADLKLQEIKQSEAQKLQERLHQEKLKHESRMREMELSLQIDEQRKRYEATQATDEYLRRDIELLILEKQRTELLNTVQKARMDAQPIKQLPPGQEPEN
ncbi:MAG: hypothetical protein CVV13_11330 [Gammaproteobacteria bacterium HGW-Gammaproteobacteria-3]|nr:MAG: hypothetical protein CVV13_11330 [Gammaproteobacteria bacterium HGW-Gammaproteobacteria-3]